MQERNSFQTLEIQHACSQAFEKDEEKRSFSPQPLPRTPGREANRKRQLGERLFGDKEIKWIQIKEHQKEKGPDFIGGCPEIVVQENQG